MNTRLSNIAKGCVTRMLSDLRDVSVKKVKDLKYLCNSNLGKTIILYLMYIISRYTCYLNTFMLFARYILALKYFVTSIYYFRWISKLIESHYSVIEISKRFI